MNDVRREEEIPYSEYKINIHKNICNYIHELYKDKNADYGDSFSKIFKKHGLLSSVIRLEDKLNRLETLISKPAAVKDESIRDTLMDLAGYAILTVLELESMGS